jgi:uncharacterized protein (TIGR03067 family)
MLAVGQRLTANPVLTLMGLATLVALDCWILWRLSRSSGSRVLRELWSGLVVLVPTVLLGAFTLATLLPYVKMVQGMTWSTRGMDQAVRKERTALQGTWKLVGGERGGQALPAKDLEGATLSFRENRFTWRKNTGEVNGSYSPGLHWRPKFLDLAYWDRQEDKWKYQKGVYELDANRLRICVAPPGALAENLPIDFSTKGNKCTLYIFQRVGAEAGKGGG